MLDSAVLKTGFQPEHWFKSFGVLFRLQLKC